MSRPRAAQVVHEGGHGVVHLRAELFHGVGDAAVHVPAAEVEGDEADARLAQAAGHQHLLAEAGAVLVTRPRVFPLDVEHLAGPAQDQVEGLRLEAVQALHQPALVDLAIDGVEGLLQRAAVAEAIHRDLQVHVLPAVPARVERRVGAAEPGGPVAEDAAEADVGRHAAGRVVGAANARQDGAEAGLDRRHAIVGRREVIPGHDEVRAAAVTGIVVRERAHEGHLVGVLGDLREDAADLDAGDVGLHGADGAAVLDRRGHLGVERFDLGGPAAEPKPDDGGVACRPTFGRRLRPSAQQVGQHEAAHAECADLEEVAASRAVAIHGAAGFTELEHAWVLVMVPRTRAGSRPKEGRRPAAGGGQSGWDKDATHPSVCWFRAVSIESGRTSSARESRDANTARSALRRGQETRAERTAGSGDPRRARAAGSGDPRRARGGVRRPAPSARRGQETRAESRRGQETRAERGGVRRPARARRGQETRAERGQETRASRRPAPSAAGSGDPRRRAAERRRPAPCAAGSGDSRRGAGDPRRCAAHGKSPPASGILPAIPRE